MTGKNKFNKTFDRTGAKYQKEPEKNVLRTEYDER